MPGKRFQGCEAFTDILWDWQQFASQRSEQLSLHRQRVPADGRDLFLPLQETPVPIPPIFNTQLIPHQLFEKVQTNYWTLVPTFEYCVSTGAEEDIFEIVWRAVLETKEPWALQL